MRKIPQFNFPEFRSATRELRSMGYSVFSPQEHDEANGFDPREMNGWEDLSEIGFDLGAALAADLTYICTTADVVVLLPGWETSSGTAAEIATARAMGKPVLTYHNIKEGGYLHAYLKRLHPEEIVAA